MENGKLTYKGMVYPWHCDHMGHMNVMWYTGKFDEATWAFFASIGLQPKELRATNRGMAALEQHITYKREGLAGDNLEIFTHPLEVKSKIVRFCHEMYNCDTGELLSTCELVGIHLDTEARKGVALPDDVFQKATSLIKQISE